MSDTDWSTDLFRLRFSKVVEGRVDPDIDEDNGLRKPVIEMFMANEYAIAGVVNAMCADGWTSEVICRTRQYQLSDGWSSPSASQQHKLAKGLIREP